MLRNLSCCLQVSSRARLWSYSWDWYRLFVQLAITAGCWLCVWVCFFTTVRIITSPDNAQKAWCGYKLKTELLTITLEKRCDRKMWSVKNKINDSVDNWIQPGGLIGRSIYICLFVCLSVCPPVFLFISSFFQLTHTSIHKHISIHPSAIRPLFSYYIHTFSCSSVLLSTTSFWSFTAETTDPTHAVMILERLPVKNLLQQNQGMFGFNYDSHLSISRII